MKLIRLGNFSFVSFCQMQPTKSILILLGNESTVADSKVLHKGKIIYPLNMRNKLHLLLSLNVLYNYDVISQK